jgi:hypothetical protein
VPLLNVSRQENLPSVEEHGADRSDRGLKHELSSPAPTLRSWVRIPLEAWMYVCLFCVCVVLCVDSGLATG